MLNMLLRLKAFGRTGAGGVVTLSLLHVTVVYVTRVT
jgi:hypothetical protein